MFEHDFGKHIISEKFLINFLHRFLLLGRTPRFFSVLKKCLELNHVVTPSCLLLCIFNTYLELLRDILQLIIFMVQLGDGVFPSVLHVLDEPVAESGQLQTMNR